MTWRYDYISVKKWILTITFIVLAICIGIFWPKEKEQELGAVESFLYAPFLNRIVEEQPDPLSIEEQIIKSFPVSDEEDILSVEENLDSWIGEYTFHESIDATESTPFMFMDYRIEIYKGLEGEYYANISINGQTTAAAGKAKVCGDEKQIELIFLEYLPDHMGGGFSDEENGVLIRFEKAGDELYTYWGEIAPMLYANEITGKVYFKKE